MSAPLNSVYGSPADYLNAVSDLQSALGQDVVSTDSGVLFAHGFSKWSYHPSSTPSVVVFALSTDVVVKTINISRKWKMPIIPFASGTGLEGQFTAHSSGGICIDLSRMDKILQINEADGDLICQAGARWDDINAQLKEKRIPLFFPLDPAPGATVGGMIATGCSGTNAVRYGTAKGEWFLNLTVVLPSGEVMKTRSRARKSSTGFDTAKLFIGAEGTLGIVTEATLRLAPLLPTSVAYVHFPDVYSATVTATEALNKGVSIQCAELLDDRAIHCLNRAGLVPFQFHEVDTIFFKFQGSPLVLNEAAEVVEEVARRHGGTGFTHVNSEQDVDRIWAARKAALPSCIRLAPPGSRCWSTDVCVPVSRLPQLLLDTKKDMKDHNIDGITGGHIGDGNFHTALLFKSDVELESVRGVVHRMIERAIALEGTCTGEHGVGIGKKEYLIPELGNTTIEVMKLVKRALDPLGLFNPGKLYPDDSDVELVSRV